MKKLLMAAMAVMTFPVLADDGLPDEPFVEVYGEGVLTVPVDHIEVHFTLAAGANDGSTARKKVDTTLAEAARILREQDVPDAALEAYQLSISEQHGRVDGEYQSVGFLAERSAILTLHDLDRAGEIMDALIEAPIQIWDGVHALPADVEQTRELARAAAVKDARRRAENYAHLVGRDLGEVYRIGDDVDWEIQLRPQALAAAYVGGVGAPIFRVGDIEIRERVRVIYLLD